MGNISWLEVELRQIITILDIVQYRSKPTDGFPRPEKKDTKHDTNAVKYFKQPKTSSNEQFFLHRLELE